MTLSNEDNILSSHFRTAADFGDLAFIGLKRNQKVSFISGRATYYNDYFSIGQGSFAIIML